jgi:pyruvate dehydrogenase E2 component (dihydrolipoamide acetyltransferase)
MSLEPITMPVLSDTMETGHLVSWQKQIGDTVKKGDTLAEVESDKAIMDIEAFHSGYLAGPLAHADSDIPVGAIIGYTADSAQEALNGVTLTPQTTPVDHEKSAQAPLKGAPPSPPEQIENRQNSDPTPAPRLASSPAKALKASPYARGLARELGVDLRLIKSDRDGVISSHEVLAAALQRPAPDLNAGPPFRYKLLTSMHRTIAENMIASLRTPTFRISAKLPTASLQQAAHRQKTSFTLLLARAAALAIQDHQIFNMVYTPVGLALRERIDVGIAVDVEGGLLTPVIRDAAQRDIGELKEDWRMLKDKIKRQRLKPSDYEGATFYISNMGMFPDVRSFDAIVPPGSAAILAVGASHDGKAIMTLSCDHRVVYGADAARFLETLRKFLDKPR